MDTVCGNPVNTSVLMINNTEVNVCYRKYDSDVFVVAVSNEKCCMEKVKRQTGEFLQVLGALHGDMAVVFSGVEIHLSVRHLIEKFADSLLQVDPLIKVNASIQ